MGLSFPFGDVSIDALGLKFELPENETFCKLSPKAAPVKQLVSVGFNCH